MPLNEYDKAKRTGVISISLREGDELADITFVDEEEVFIVTKNGMIIRFSTLDMPISSRTAQGVKGIALKEEDSVFAVLPIAEKDKYLAIISNNGYGKKINVSEFVVQKRGGRGICISKTPIAGALTINDEDRILIVGNASSIVIESNEVPEQSKTPTLGNIFINNNTSVISASKV